MIGYMGFPGSFCDFHHLHLRRLHLAAALGADMLDVWVQDHGPNGLRLCLVGLVFGPMCFCASCSNCWLKAMDGFANSHPQVSWFCDVHIGLQGLSKNGISTSPLLNHHFPEESGHKLWIFLHVKANLRHRIRLYKWVWLNIWYPKISWFIIMFPFNWFFLGYTSFSDTPNHPNPAFEMICLPSFLVVSKSKFLTCFMDTSNCKMHFFPIIW